ncbi:hypothetical protein COBT_002208 [Conglomerata obtusa]
MYPLTLIRISKGKTIEIETKNNETYAGILSGCDLLMNLNLKNVTVVTQKDETYFLKECYLKGAIIKCVKLNKDVLDVQKKLESRERQKK